MILKVGVNDVKTKKSGESDEPMDLIEVAKINEFGYEHVPPRPAFRRGTDIAIRANKKLVNDYMSDVWQLVNSDRSASVKKKEIKKMQGVMLHRIGVSAVKNVKNIIEQKKELQNAPSTIRRKKFNHPLYETGQLLENVNFEVVEKSDSTNIIKRTIKEQYKEGNNRS